MKAIPYLLLPERLARGIAGATPGIGACAQRCFPDLDEKLTQAELPFDTKGYLSICLASDIVLFIAFGFIIGLALPYSMSFPLSLLLSAFVLAQQLLYPSIVATRRVAAIERNLLAALQDMHVQLTAGIPLYDVIANAAHGDYGELSVELRKAIDRITLGEEQMTVLHDLATRTPSVYLRRVLWQLTNSMRAGSDVSGTIGNIIETLGEERLIQLERFGSQLNPIAMMYMLLGVITPSLSITFLVLLGSVVTMSDYTITFIFGGVYVLFLFTQAVFIGIVKTKRPNLL